MKHFCTLFIATILFLSGCKSPTETKPTLIYNKEFKWTIAIPAGFDTVSTEKLDEMQQRGMAAMEQTHNMALENHSKNIFIFQSDQFNYFQSNYQPFDTSVDSNYQATFKAVNDLVYETFQAKLGEDRVDSIYSTQIISGLEFQCIKMLIKLPDNRMLNLYMYNRLFGSKELSVNIIAVDKQKEKELLDVWLHSKFGN